MLKSNSHNHNIKSRCSKENVKTLSRYLAENIGETVWYMQEMIQQTFNCWYIIITILTVSPHYFLPLYHYITKSSVFHFFNPHVAIGGTNVPSTVFFIIISQPLGIENDALVKWSTQNKCLTNGNYVMASVKPEINILKIVKLVTTEYLTTCCNAYFLCILATILWQTITQSLPCFLYIWPYDLLSSRSI